MLGYSHICYLASGSCSSWLPTRGCTPCTTAWVLLSPDTQLSVSSALACTLLELKGSVDGRHYGEGSCLCSWREQSTADMEQGLKGSERRKGQQLRAKWDLWLTPVHRAQFFPTGIRAFMSPLPQAGNAPVFLFPLVICIFKWHLMGIICVFLWLSSQFPGIPSQEESLSITVILLGLPHLGSSF